MTIIRRSFLTGLGALLAAPAIVKADSLMHIRGVVLPALDRRWLLWYGAASDALGVRLDVANFKLAIPQYASPAPEHIQATLERLYPELIDRVEAMVRVSDAMRLAGVDFRLTGETSLIPHMGKRTRGTETSSGQYTHSVITPGKRPGPRLRNFCLTPQTAEQRK
jgi:hypothetical protein